MTATDLDLIAALLDPTTCWAEAAVEAALAEAEEAARDDDRE